jgi:class 3 adenylate cyclase
MPDAPVSTAVLNKFAQRARWRAFRDPSVEASFRVWHREQILPAARLAAIGPTLIWVVVPLWFALTFGQTPSVLVIGAWAIAVPALLGLLLVTHARLRRWVTEAAMLVNVVIGLDFVWIMSSVYGPTSGTVTAGVFATIFFPLIVRISTGKTAVITTTLTSVPVALLIDGTRRGHVALVDSWPYIVVLALCAPLIVVAAALIESGMRQQFAAQSLLQASQRLLRRYAPAAVADRIESGDAESVGQPQRLRVTALSSDVAGFTALADRIDPESLSHIINEYVATMSDVVESQHGVVTEYAGDGLMAVFGAPEQLDPADQVRHALAAARAMHARLAELNESWYHLGIEHPLKVRVGINTGMLSVGTFGSDGRATYTAIGLQMNVAARIQAQCEPGRTLLSSASWHLIKDEVECEPLGEVTVKGVHFPISIYVPRS